MENLGSGGGFLAGPSGRMFDLEFPVRRQQQQPQLGQNSLMPGNHMINLENDHQHSMGLMMELKGSNGKGFSMNFGKGKAVSPIDPTHCGSASEEDEPGFTEDGNGEKSKKESQWQRMKWTDDIVRLLIAVVACVGDDGTVEEAEGLKRKPSVLHKKGKWKTVSKIMISKGCHVSPQQCEDKFNDLNKRYKRLNEILGRGTSCRVVENPSLMDSMPHLSAKAKDDVRKILSSKHLFYKEMCAYHNGQRIPNCQDLDLQGYSLPLERCAKENNGSDEDEAAGNDDSDEDEMDSDNDNNADRDEERTKEGRHFGSLSRHWDNFQVEMAGIFQDPTKSSFERNEWVKKQSLQLQEQRVNLEMQSFELEKQRLKWIRYCKKKDRELQRMRLENERMRLDNEQSIVHLKQKELEIEFRHIPPASRLV